MTWSACRPVNAFFPLRAAALVTLVVEKRNRAFLPNAYVQLTVLYVGRTASMVPSRPASRPASHWQQRCHQDLLPVVDPCPEQDLASTDHLQEWAREATQLHLLEQQIRQGKLQESVLGNH